jgi:hypothetical protein
MATNDYFLPEIRLFTRFLRAALMLSFAIHIPRLCVSAASRQARYSGGPASYHPARRESLCDISGFGRQGTLFEFAKMCR